MYLIIFLQSKLLEEAKTLFNHLANLGNPIYYSIFLLFFTISIIIVFFKYVYIPIQETHAMEKQNLELKNARLMALFAELDPDPVIRVDMEGNIILTNEAAHQIDKAQKITGGKIPEILPFIDIDFKSHIRNNELKIYTKSINRKHYSILVRGNAYLEICQIYFRDITDQKKAERKLILSQKKLKDLSTHLQNILEEERQRISRELHDGVGQNLSLTRLQLNNLMPKIRSEKTFTHLQKVVSSLDSTIAELKDISYRLKPKVLDEMGIGPAVVSLVNSIRAETDIKGSVNLTNLDSRLNPKLEICIYRIIQESINNIIKHSKATEFDIQLIKTKKFIRLLVSDNGVGFNATKVLNRLNVSKGMGLTNIRERIINYEGNLKIDSSPGDGTVLIVEIPNKKSLWKIVKT